MLGWCLHPQSLEYVVLTHVHKTASHTERPRSASKPGSPCLAFHFLCSVLCWPSHALICSGISLFISHPHLCDSLSPRNMWKDAQPKGAISPRHWYQHMPGTR